MPVSMFADSGPARRGRQAESPPRQVLNNGAFSRTHNGLLLGGGSITGSIYSLRHGCGMKPGIRELIPL
jgi:hypothetical protein